MDDAEKVLDNVTWTKSETVFKIVYQPSTGKYTHYYIAGERWYSRLWRWISWRWEELSND